MKNTFKYILFSLSFILLIGMIIYKLDDFNDLDEVEVIDALKFKEDYESLNGKKNAYGRDYPEIEIDEDNVIKYSDVLEIEKVVKGGTGVIYLGYPGCPWCRNAVPVLLQAASDAGIETIYYIDMTNERDRYSVSEDGELVLEEEGTEDYRKLLELFDEYLDEYYVEDSEGNEIDTEEKRIYVPIVFFVREGKIIGTHSDTVDSQENPYVLLDDNQYEELYTIYTGYMHEVLNDLCDERC